MRVMRYKRAEGTHDILPPGKDRTEWVDDIRKWHWVEGIVRDLTSTYGYEEVRTPMFEDTALFRRAVGEGTDIVHKEMYEFETRGKDRLTLRPEGTAPVLRAFVEQHLHFDRPVSKLYYLAEIFRYEAPQKGRYRQHHQFGVEVLGAGGPDVDAEVIALAMAFFRRVGVERLTLKINSVGTLESRNRYVQALRDFATPFLSKMSEDNQRRYRENALRMLDSKDERDQDLLKDAPLLTDFLDADCRTHFDGLLELLASLGVEYEVDPRLVRGFDYYTRTAFEIQSPDVGAQSTLCGGGRYDRLIEDLDGPPTPGIGFGLGIERALIALQQAGLPAPNPPTLTAFLCPIGETARKAAVPLLARLRTNGIAADMDYTGRRLGEMLAQGDELGAKYTIVFGDDELASGTFQLNDMNDKEEKEIKGVVRLVRKKGRMVTTEELFSALKAAA
jgi:histidyl-tRNA synthetase